jgi:hypothetical protein
MEIFIYSIDGREVRVSKAGQNAFLNKYPDAVLVRTEQPEDINFQPGTTNVGVTEVPANIQTPDTGFKPADYFSESQEDKYAFEEPFQGTFFGDVVLDFFGDIGRAVESGAAAGMSVDEAFDIYKQGASVSDEQLDAFIAADRRIQSKGMSDEMLQYQKEYEEAGGGILGFLIANAKTRGQVLPQIIASSIATMATSLESGEVQASAAAGAATGAVVGSVATPIGTLTGAVGGGVAGLVGAMETSLTLSELLKEELGDKEFNKENIRKILEDPQKLNDLKNKSIGRGIAIGAIEGITLGISRGMATSLKAAGTSGGAIARRAAFVEGVGGSTGEIAGRIAAGQEMDTSDILFEGVAELKGVVNVADIISKKSYKVNGEVRNKKDVLKFLSEAKPEELAGADIDIINDANLKAVVEAKQLNVSMNAKFQKAGITNAGDRARLITLENERLQYVGASTKTEKTNLADIDADIKEITDKYRRRGPKTAEQKANIAQAEAVEKAAGERSVKKTIRFAETEGKRIGLETIVADDSKSFEANLKKDGIKLSKADIKSIDRVGGYIKDNKIYINKEAAAKTGQINVGAHEVLHGIIAAADIKNINKLVTDFKNTLDADTLAQLENNMRNRQYGYNEKGELVDQNVYDQEYLTNFSDMIEDGSIKFNENVFTKLQDAIVNFLKIFGYENINFKDGRGVYNFMKEYSKNIKEGKLSKAVLSQVKGNTKVQGAMSVSPTAVAKINEIYQNTANKEQAGYDIVFNNEEINYKGMAENYLNEFLANPNLSDEQKAIITRNRPDIVAQMLYDKIPSQRKGSKLRNVVGMVLDFESQKQKYNNLAAYINTFFKKRGLESINYYLKDSGIKSIETEEGTLRKDVQKVAADVLDESGPRQGQNIRKKKEKESFERKITLTELANDILKNSETVLKDITTVFNKEIKLIANKGKISIDKVEKVVQKQLRSIVIDAMGKIKSEAVPGTNKRRAVIPASYSTIIETKFNEIADAMSLTDIKKRYNKLFKVTEIGREKTAEGNPIFTIGKPVKAEFIKYFTDTNIAMTTLVERQKMLGEIITKAITSKILREYNSNDSLIELAQIANLNPAEGAKAVTELQLANEINDVAKQLDTYEGEKMLQDTRLFSRAPSPSDIRLATKGYEVALEHGINSKKYAALNLPSNINGLVKFLVDKYIIKGTRKSGIVYEKLLGDFIAKQGKLTVLNKDIKDDYDASRPDLQIKLDVPGKEPVIFNVEAKLDSKALFGTVNFNFDLKNKEFKIKRNKQEVGPAEMESYELFEAIAKKQLPLLQPIVDLINEIEGSNITTVPFGKSIKESTWEEVKKSKLLKNLLTDPITSTSVAENYNAKGMYYIQIGDKGLYYLGEDILRLGVPKFDVAMSARVRLKKGTGKPGMVKLTISTEPAILKPENLKPSEIDLNTKKGVQQVEKTILEKEGTYASHIRDSRKGKFSRAPKIATGKRATLDQAFNDIIEEKTGIVSNKVYSKERARVAGKKNKKMSFYIPPSAEDFTGLMYKLLSKGKLGNAQMAWIKKHMLNPYAKAMDQISSERVELFERFRALKKEISAVPKKLKKKLPGTDDTYETAVRVYMWDKQGMDIPGLTKKEIKELVSVVKKDKELKAFGDELMTIFPGAYPQAQSFWLSGNITTDFLNGLNTTRRAEILSKWQANVDEIFSEKNLNKLESQFGNNYRDALENILGRMKTGTNRPITDNKRLNRFYDWINGSVGVVMFLNMRSAVLQTISMVNYINWNDNNILAASKAFGNQKQYWADFLTIWNSDFLRNRRGQLQLNVSETEIADMADKGGVRGVVNYLLKLGYTPTRVADSFAIASGGASLYRNRTKSYMKNGFSQEEAEIQAFRDFQELTEEAQQSSRPDRISKQQASTTGRLFLAWANTPMQYGRLIKRATQDLIAGRGDRNTNLSKIVHYSFLQNIVFNFMQKGAFALAFAQEEDDEKKRDKYGAVAESMADSVIRGSGIHGTFFIAAKSFVKDVIKETKKSRPDYEGSLWKILEATPPLDAKMDRARDVAYAFQYEKEEMIEEGLTIGSPGLEAIASGISFATNVPVDRGLRKMENIQAALDEQTDTWARIALLLGWNEWSLGLIEDETAPTKGRKPIKKRKAIPKRK